MIDMGMSGLRMADKTSLECEMSLIYLEISNFIAYFVIRLTTIQGVFLIILQAPK